MSFSFRQDDMLVLLAEAGQKPPFALPYLVDNMHTQIPEKYTTYGCKDYFQGDWPVDGYFDEPSQTLVIVPLNEIYEVTESSFLAVGRSGLGGIDFGYRKNFTGLWAFYPVDQEFKFMASGIQELVDGWCSGRLFI